MQVKERDLADFISIDCAGEAEADRHRLQTKTVIMFSCVSLTADHGDVRWRAAGHSFSRSAKKPSLFSFLLLLSTRPAVV